MTDKYIDIPDETPTSKTFVQLYQENRMARKRLSTLLEYLPDPVFAFSLDNKVEYVNPAFERIFGWTLDEIQGKNIDFIPEHMTEQAKEGMRLLYKNRYVHDFETQRLTKDGRILDIAINGAILYDENDQPTGQALILRDMTHEKRMAKSNRIMFNISKALHQQQKLGDLIAVITKEIQELINVEGAFILLADESKDQLYFLSAQYKDGATEKKFKKIRFAADQGVSGRVYKTGEPMIVPDVDKCSFYLRRVSDETDLKTRNFLSVPMKLKDRTIGVVSVVNKHFGQFDQTDMDLLSMVASTIALPIENTRIHEKLELSYQELKGLNQAKDRVINHLAHELKTPVSVLGASMKLLGKKLAAKGFKNEQIEKILDRGQRNLKRILDIQYEVEDLLQKKEFKSFHLLNRLLDACADELSVLFESETENKKIIDAVQQTIDKLFGPKNLPSDTIDLKNSIYDQIKMLTPQFSHRACDINLAFEDCSPVVMPEPILAVLITGLLKNAIEYTPDNGRVDISLNMVDHHPELTIKDFGIGITKEKLQLIFDDFFTPPASMDYSTKAPFEFNAGGRGFDLLRIKLFSGQYGFSIDIDSKRCPVIPNDIDLCPGDIQNCASCASNEDCLQSGGTSIRIRFPKNSS